MTACSFVVSVPVCWNWAVRAARTTIPLFIPDRTLSTCRSLDMRRRGYIPRRSPLRVKCSCRNTSSSRKWDDGSVMTLKPMKTFHSCLHLRTFRRRRTSAIDKTVHTLVARGVRDFHAFCDLGYDPGNTRRLHDWSATDGSE